VWCSRFGFGRLFKGGEEALDSENVNGRQNAELSWNTQFGF
jgi:hypothetical protein